MQLARCHPFIPFLSHRRFQVSGTVVKILVENGKAVTPGQGLLIVN
jgi:hypothetical protein